jgi:hypothetical protein
MSKQLYLRLISALVIGVPLWSSAPVFLQQSLADGADANQDSEQAPEYIQQLNQLCKNHSSLQDAASSTDTDNILTIVPDMQKLVEAVVESEDFANSDLSRNGNNGDNENNAVSIIPYLNILWQVEGDEPSGILVDFNTDSISVEKIDGIREQFVNIGNVAQNSEFASQLAACTQFAQAEDGNSTNNAASEEEDISDSAEQPKNNISEWFNMFSGSALQAMNLALLLATLVTLGLVLMELRRWHNLITLDKEDSGKQNQNIAQDNERLIKAIEAIPTKFASILQQLKYAAKNTEESTSGVDLHSMQTQLEKTLKTYIDGKRIPNEKDIVDVVYQKVLAELTAHQQKWSLCW